MWDLGEHMSRFLSRALPRHPTEDLGGWLVVVGAFAVLAPAWTLAPIRQGPIAWVDVMTGTGFVAAATIAAFVMWRRPGGRLPGSAVAAGLAVSTQALLVTLVTLTDSPASEGVAHLSLMALGVAGLACVAGAVLDLTADPATDDDTYVVALGLGLVAEASLVLQLPITALGTVERMLLGLVLSTPVLAVVLVVATVALTRRTKALLVFTTIVCFASIAVEMSRPEAAVWVVGASLARALAGAVWLGAGWVCLQRLAREERLRVEDMGRALAATRAHREQLHELRSTVAGLVNGSEMLDHSDIPADARQRMWASVRRELDRLQRMLTDHDVPPSELDLDETLDVILELQRLKGRNVELHGGGAVVEARYDGLAEVMNILLDNASVHGGCDDSVVEVVRRNDSVDIEVTDFGRGIPAPHRETIFGWGDRGEDSPGEGIGLNLAERLVARDGGALRLVERKGPGSTFVISLPAPRAPFEDTLGERYRP